MSANPHVAKYAIDWSYRFTLSWDLEFDITDPDLSLRRELEEVPLKGEWELDVRRMPGEKVKLSVLHGKGLTEGLFGRVVNSTFELFWVDEVGVSHSITATTFDAPLPKMNHETQALYVGRSIETTPPDLLVIGEKSNNRFIPSTHRSYRFSATFEHLYPNDPKHIECRQQIGVEQKEIAERIAGAFSLFLLFLR
jgi:hypothetical protein